ncbi:MULTISPECIES: ABC transporter permease [Nitratireductor]|uniref:ABC transporter permease n=1 Tax=Nitratireductor TaxID=245876 RepID=UPI000D0DCDD9|nr:MULTISPECIES: ABC transporter permease [Nitratireductor]PSM20071.1 amino acid ABC transporter permease [Nitratireductor sp. StC3]
MTALQERLEASERPPALPRTWTGERIAGNLVLAFWLVAGVLMVWYLVEAWAPEKVERYGPKYISGLLTTLSLVGLSLVIGAALSIPVAIGRMSKNKLISRIAFAYVYVFRGTPLIAQLFLIYYGLGSFRPQLEAVGLWGFFREAWNCAVFSFALNTAAYQAEILRGAVESVPKGQWEGAAALGLNRVQTLYKIILPQALIVALRPYGNEIILMIKGSAIVALATVYDLMGETRRAYSRTYDFQTYIWAAIFYLVIVETLRNVWSVVEARLTRHLQR